MLDSLLGKDDRGDAIVTTLDAGAQQEAYTALQESGHKGALVALNVRTGGVLAMASSPSYDPNTINDPATLRRAQPRHGERAAGQPRHAERLPAGLDDEGGHRRGGAGHAAATAPTRA